MNQRDRETADLPVEVHRQIDRFCLTYEHALREGKRPDLARAVRKQKPRLQAPLLAELLAVDMEWRRGQGERPSAEEYTTIFPEHAETVERVWREVASRLGLGAVGEAETVSIAAAGADTSRRGEGQLRRPNVRGGRIGPYELLEQVGVGAFGAVWKSRDTRLDRFVAVKSPRRNALDRDEVEKFLREARAAAQLRHPHIVQVYDVEEAEGVPYIVSEFIAGGSLAQWIQGRRLSIPAAVELAIPIGEALHHAHECGVIHRDLKPANILLDASRRPHLTDFGLARWHEGNATMTVEGTVLGTPAYMSPEQARGASHDADRRTDVYSLGVLLFELLTGELPFRGSIQALLQQIVERAAPSPRQFNSTVPRDLETITLKCLEKSPKARYATCAEVVDELHRFQRDEPIVARPVGRLGEVWRWCRRKPVVAGSAAVVALTVMIATVVSLRYAEQALESARIAEERRLAVAAQEQEARLQTKRAEEAARLADEQKRAAEQSALRAAAEEQVARERMRELERSRYNAELASFTASMRHNDVGRYLTLFDERKFPKSLREFSWSCGVRTAGSELTRLVAIPAEQRPDHNFDNNIYRALDLSPDESLLALGTRTHAVVLYDWERGDVVRVLDHHAAWITMACFSADGRILGVCDTQGEVSLWDVAKGSLLHAAKFRIGARCLAFSPDGSQLAIGQTNGTKLVLMDLRGGEFAQKEISLRINGPQQAIHWIDDDELVVGIRANGGAIRRVNVPQETVRELCHGDSSASHIFEMAVSPDKRLLVSCDKDFTYVWDLETGEEVTRVELRAHRLTFSPDGSQLAVVSLNEVQLLETETWEALLTFQLAQSSYPLARYLDHGRRLLTGVSSGWLCEWRTEPTSLRMGSLGPEESDYLHTVLSADEGLFVGQTWPRRIVVRNLRSGRLVRTVDEGKESETQPVEQDVAVIVRSGIVAALTDWRGVTCWDANTGAELWRKNFEFPEKETWSRVFTCWPIDVNGEALIGITVSKSAFDQAAGFASVLALYDARGGEEVVRFDDVTSVASVAFARNRGLLAELTFEGTVVIWAVPGFERVAEVACGGTVLDDGWGGLAFSPDESTLVAVDGVGRTTRIDTTKWTSQVVGERAAGGGRGYAFTPDGGALVCRRRDKAVILDATTVEERGVLMNELTGKAMQAAFDDQGGLYLGAVSPSSWCMWSSTQTDWVPTTPTSLEELPAVSGER